MYEVKKTMDLGTDSTIFTRTIFGKEIKYCIKNSKDVSRGEIELDKLTVEEYSIHDLTEAAAQKGRDEMTAVYNKVITKHSWWRRLLNRFRFGVST